MMSCCGCASRVLKLQSEIRSWKRRLGDEKREKKMMLRWIMAVFGYDVKVEIESETHVVRLQATENKDAMSKAIIKSVIGSEEDCGVMLMEVKLEDDEYYEPFEEPDVPDFPILEINSMATSTSTRPGWVNIGIPTFSRSSQLDSQAMSITTPMEIATTPIPVTVNPLNPEQDVLYIAGNLEEGATLEGPYIIVRANEGEDISVPMDYSTIVPVSVVSSTGYFAGPSSAMQSGQGNIRAINYLTSSKPIPAPLPVPSVIKSELIDPHLVPHLQYGTTCKESSSSSKPLSKKKTSASTKSSIKMSSKKKALVGDGEMDIKIKSVSSQATFNNGTLDVTKASFISKPGDPLAKDSKKLTKSGSGTPKRGDVFGLTLREKAEIYVIQKAREVVEKLSNGSGFRCTACDKSRVFPSIEYATGHAKTHFESKPYKCDSCDELFPIQKELLKHRKAVHQKPNKTVASVSSRVSQSDVIYKTANTKASNTGSGAPGLLRLSSSGTIPTNSTSCISNSSTKSIMVQAPAPFDKKLMTGPISVSNEVLAAILGAGVRVTFSSANSDNLRNLSRV